MSRLCIDKEGRLPLPRPVAEAIGRSSLEVVSSSDRHLFLTSGQDGPEVVFAGRVGEVGIPDVLSFLNMFRKTGILSFCLEGGKKDLYFDCGEIVYAASTFPHEDLGEILLLQEKVGGDVLQKARRLAPDSIALGRLLIEKKIVTAKDVWLATRQAVEEIVYHLFTFHVGSFSYLHQSLVDNEILRLSLSTQNLIMEGLRRVDERALFMRTIRSLDAIPIATGMPVSGLSEREQRVMEIIRPGNVDVREILRRSALGEFEGLRILFQLSERKVVEFTQPSSASPDGELGEVLALFNETLVAIHGRMSAQNPDFREEVRLFLLDLPQPFSYVFRDVAMREDGAVDGGRILSNLAGLEEGDKKKLLADGMSELVYMECHLARKELGSAGSAELLQRVQDVSRRVNALVGGMNE